MQHSRKFEENYEMKPRHFRPSFIEPGSIDASDWDIAGGEFNQQEEEKEEKLNYLDGEIERFNEELNTIHRYKYHIDNGDRKLIKELAGYEQERREKIEKQRQEVEKMKKIFAEKKAGKEMDGVQETELVIQKLIDLVHSGGITENKPGENGWELERKWNKRYDYNKNDSQIELKIIFPETLGVRVEIATYSGPILPYEKREEGRIDIGELVGFTLKEGKIYDWNKSEVKRSFQWGYPDYSSSVEPFGQFEQSDFDNTRNVVSELYSDLNSLSSK